MSSESDVKVVEEHNDEELNSDPQNILDKEEYTATTIQSQIDASDDPMDNHAVHSDSVIEEDLGLQSRSV